MSAINSIVAKGLILLDAMLEPFVTVSTAALPSNCSIYQISGGLTACGEEVLAYRVMEIVFDVIILGSDLVPWAVVSIG